MGIGKALINSLIKHSLIFKTESGREELLCQLYKPTAPNTAPIVVATNPTATRRYSCGLRKNVIGNAAESELINKIPKNPPLPLENWDLDYDLNIYSKEGCSFRSDLVLTESSFN